MTEGTPIVLTPEVIAFIDSRVHAAMNDAAKNIKVWILSSVLILLVGVFGGVGAILFQLGELSQQFESLTKDNETFKVQRVARAKHAYRKDALDESFAHFLRKDGYEPPSWFHGRDAEELGVQ